MKNWAGAAAICLNEKNEILMVREKNKDTWAVPSGEIEAGETPEQCCIREVLEETGYPVQVNRPFYEKNTELEGYRVKTHYFLVEKTGEGCGIKDPDQLIAEAEWKSLTDIERMEHAYPEDKEMLVRLLQEMSPTC